MRKKGDSAMGKREDEIDETEKSILAELRSEFAVPTAVAFAKAKLYDAEHQAVGENGSAGLRKPKLMTPPRDPSDPRPYFDRPDLIEFTSIRYGDCSIHFRYLGTDYTLVTSADCGSATTCLYRGRMAGVDNGNLIPLGSCYGWIRDLIRYEGGNKTLKHVDKTHFVEELRKNGIAF
jgi:hypothetical protein